MVKTAVLIDEGRAKANGKVSVEVGDSVEVMNAQGEKITYMIVGSNGADPAQNKISNESPLGKAFLQRAIGEEVEVFTPIGKQRFKVVGIK